MGKKSKKVRIPQAPGKTNKTPRTFLCPKDDKFLWAIRSDKIDWHHSYYGFSVRRIPSFIRYIKPKLDEYTSMRWCEVEQKKSCHPMDAYVLSKNFLDRINELFGEDAPETLYQIRLDSEHRIWGYREENIFYVMFNDPKHQGYPVKKKHT
ncbi:MAG: hypothetical protein J6J74_07390 [Elusimicrobiaceae bacterium]|nr:hypothetical protein [Elusimicrobiaceae bacterium]